MNLCENSAIVNQTFVVKPEKNKPLPEKVPLLIWLYLGHNERENSYSNVAFINGSGVCSENALTVFMCMKKLKTDAKRLIEANANKMLITR